MPSSCWAPNCTNRLGPGSSIKMHRFPSDKARLDRWLVAIGRMCGKNQTTTRGDGLLEPKDHDRLCSAHFVSGKPSAEPTDIDYRPTIFQHTSSHKKRPSTLKRILERQDRVKEHDEKKSRQDVACALLELSVAEVQAPPQTGVSTQTEIPTNTIGTQTDTTRHDINKLEEEFSIQQENIERLQNSINNMKHALGEDAETSYEEKVFTLEKHIKALHDQIKQIEKNTIILSKPFIILTQQNQR